jgi:large subunit ribosomal protein L24
MKKTQKTVKGKRPRIKKGDEVIVITGEDKGTQGRVLEVYPDKNRVLVEGVAVARRSYKKGVNPNLPQGGIHDKGMPVHISNVMLVDPKSGDATRVGVRTETDKEGKIRRIRFAKASGADFSN